MTNRLYSSPDEIRAQVRQQLKMPQFKLSGLDTIYNCPKIGWKNNLQVRLQYELKQWGEPSCGHTYILVWTRRAQRICRASAMNIAHNCKNSGSITPWDYHRTRISHVDFAQAHGFGWNNGATASPAKLLRTSFSTSTNQSPTPVVRSVRPGRQYPSDSAT